jgi:hypothetical protein
MFVHARFALTLALAMLSANASAETRWQRVSADGRKVGHNLITRTVDERGVLEREELEVQLGASARRVRYRATIEFDSAPDGSLRRLSREIRTPEGHSRVVAEREGNHLVVTSGIGRRLHRTVLENAAVDLKSAEFARAWLAAAGRGENPAPLVYRTWDPTKLSVTEIELRANQAGETNVERRVRSAQGVSGARQRVDAQGNVIYELMSFGAYDFEVEDAPEHDARAGNEVFDHIAPLLRKSPYRIPVGDMRRKIRYAFDNAGWAAEIPAGAGQRTWTEGQTTWIQVCASCAPDPVTLTDAERSAALRPSEWLQSADAKLVRRATALTERSRDSTTRMKRLTSFVRGHMGTRVDMLGYGSALEALESRRGDCTEYAVLLAALGRAAGIPTRIAIGQVYARQFEGSRHVFVPHAWVQAWTGSGWESFDAAIGTFDSTHLAFVTSYDGSPLNHYAGVQLSREMKMTSAARVVPKKPAS